MPYIIEVKLVPTFNNKYTDTESKQDQIEFITNQYTETIADHRLIYSDESTTFDKK